jgi:hypothetical protein
LLKSYFWTHGRDRNKKVFGDQIDRSAGSATPKTPLSDHLLGIFAEWGKSFVGLSPDFELMFERFELLGSLAHLEQNKATEVQAQLAAGHVTWFPYGRLGWHSQNREKLFAEMRSQPVKEALTKAGFAQRNPAFVNLFISNFERMIVKLSW